MRTKTALTWVALLCLPGALAGAKSDLASRMPYAAAGMTERQAAAHLLDRFAYGARPGEIDRVAEMGLDRWLESQLSASLPDKDLHARLSSLKSLHLTSREILDAYPQMNVVRNAAIREGILTQADFQQNPQQARRKLQQFAREKGYRPPQDLATDLMSQKLLRAVYSRNSLMESLTDFWFNHFNVSLTDGQARPFLLSYERDAIRPHALGRFRNLLGATAKHPAMLHYLDNAQSNAPEGAPTLMQQAVRRNNGANRRRNPRRPALQRRMAAAQRERDQVLESEDVLVDGNAPVMERSPSPAMEPGNPGAMERKPAANTRRPNAAPRPRPAMRRMRRGINENYARELMELHTLGVDGGYTQKDVIDVARTLTGWTIYPQGPRAEQLRRRIERQGDRAGFVHAGDFLFRPDIHDAGEKNILGVAFPAGRGIDEGEQVLDLLSRHPSTAQFISRKLAVRFVSDAPPKALVDRLSKTFLRTEGDVKAMVRTLVESPEFWAPEARRAKIKSPFELIASSLRALNADVRPTRQLLQWSARMGQPLYAYQPPTGYPDRASAWVNTGSLLNRMNFGLQIAHGNVPGVKVDLSALNGGREPESVEDALETYAAILLPERDLSETLRRLAPVARDPALAEKVDRAAPNTETSAPEPQEKEAMESYAPAMAARPTRPAAVNRRGMNRMYRRNAANQGNQASAALAQVVGVLLGSPEFQRR